MCCRSWRSRSRTRASFDGSGARPRPWALPTVAVAEMAFGIEKLAEGRRREELLDALRRLVVEFADRLFDFNVKAAWAYGRILATARRAGRPMTVPDAEVAAIAEANGCALATRSVKAFATTGLELIDPWRSET